MPLDIVLWPDPILLAGTARIEQVDEELRRIVGEMRRVMFELRGVGLAAPQVGIARRLMLVCPSGEPGDEEVVINPEILDAEGQEIGEEGCLSFPGLYGMVPRARTIRVRYRDLDFREREMVLTGFVARVFLHEFDHLDGRVFVDRMTPESRAKIETGLADLKQQYAARAS
jgi:peptide deformylase